MKPPLLKVALYWNQEVLRIRSSTSIIVRSGINCITLPGGEISLRLQESQPAQRQTWLWIGNVHEAQLAETLQRILENSGLITCLWSVGLNPDRDDWRPRGYRVLVKSDDPRMEMDDLRLRLQELQSALKPVEIVWPEGLPSGTATLIDADGRSIPVDLPITLETDSGFAALEAPVGEGFHWQHQETLSLSSPMWVAIGTEGRLCAGVEVEVEGYLTSVNSSEMPAEAPIEFLKAQVVAARSWLFANWGSHHPGEPYIVCNGDHCQCFYGLNRIEESSHQAAASTSGEVLLYQDRICDARYAKTCGGVTEPAGNVWPFMEEPYLGQGRDLPGGEPLDLSKEAAFRDFQEREAGLEACCSPGFVSFPGKLQELARLYRWHETLDLRELRRLIVQKTQMDVGDIQELRPLQRGPSGRLIALGVHGSRGYLLLTPELAIRRALSKAHLPSSAFWVEYQGDETIILHGQGWGHGVGLCQMGAAGLALKGHSHSEILSHYYPNTSLRKIY